ncbi:MarR family transcriptional regulator [Collinsella sp. An271]|uniref:MarR family winged helix-turn-helix transcriptional regulator n=1 Tax=Collinsella sp. An271 TaxID=1965616 RepID=UPI001302CECB|nr:MarR family transcriptional regulator [Collinsella sp. An271]
MEHRRSESLPGDIRPIHHELLRAFSHSNRAMLSRTRALGLKPGQPKVLEYVVDHEGCTQRAIADACVMDRSTTTSILARMEAEGLIARRSDEVDRRSSSVYLTDSGREAARRVLAICNEVDSLAWNGFTDEERSSLSDLLARVIDNLSHDEESL